MLNLAPTPSPNPAYRCSYQPPAAAECLVIYRLAVADFAGREAALTSLLTPAEQQQALRYARHADQQRFRVGRAGLRYLLGQRLGQAPAAIGLRLGRYGKPQLAEPAGLHFNVAHSGGWVVVALAAREIGIDLEQLVPDFSYAEVAAQRLTQVEQHLLAQSNEPQVAFYQLWTQLEARAKASGHGLAAEEQQLAGSYAAGQWTVQNFSLIPGHPGAIAYPADWQPVIQFRTLDPQLIG